jgi:uncharacterized protein (TIGR04222 family)
VNPFDLDGPGFALFYLLLIAVAVLAGNGLRTLVGNRRPVADDRLDPYEAAWLVGGTDRTIAAAVACLLQNQIVAISRDGQFIEVRATLPRGSHMLEKAIVGDVRADGRRTVRSLSGLLSPVVEVVNAIQTSLAQRGLGLTNGMNATSIALAEAPLVLTFLIGAVRWLIGAALHHPIGYLTAELLFLIVPFIYQLRPLRPTRAGKRALERFRTEHSATSTTARTAPWSLSGIDVAATVALYGVKPIAWDRLAPLRPAFARISPGGSYNSFNSLTGCGAVGCGGGGGGAGGGGGGGGCGGGGCGGGGCGG